MFIYGLLLIPIIFTIVMYFKFRYEVVWWEYLLIFGSSIIAIFVSKGLIELSQTSDTEYWGSYITETRYYEKWDEYIHRICESCSGSGEDRSCYTYDCSYVDTHYPYWTAIDNDGRTFNITEGEYTRLKNKFATGAKFVDMHRHYHRIDGDMYKTVWDGSVKRFEAAVTSHRYENRVRVSSSNFSMKEPPEEIFNEYGLYHYPKIYDEYKQDVLIGYNDNKAEKKLEYLNSIYGKKYEFKSFIMVFRNKPLEAGLYQEQQWQGGNKNELNITIGIDNNDNVQWCHVFSWTPEPRLMVDTKKLVESQTKLNLNELLKHLEDNVPKMWVRKEFKEFSYLTVEPKWYHILIATIVVIAINIGVGYYVVTNEFTE